MRTAVVASGVGILLVLKAAAMLLAAAGGVSHDIDDAYYYLIIARNFAQTGIPTFDGIHATNGFHPLWMLLLAAMYRAIGPDASLFTQTLAAEWVEVVALAFACGVCVYAYHRLRDETPALAWGFVGAALVFFVPTFLIWEQGMESTLAAGLLLLSLYAMLDGRRKLLAATLPLLFLARLDSLVFVIAPLLAWWWLRGRPMHWKPVVPLAVVVVAYLALNLAFTGHANTIAGQIKSSFPAITPHFVFLRTPIDMAPLDGWAALWAAPNILFVTAATILLAIVWAWRRKESWAGPVGLALVICGLLVANILLFQRWDKGVEPRYLSLPYSLLGFSAFALVAGIFRAPAIVFLILSLGSGFALAARVPAAPQERIDRRTHFEVMSKIGPRERVAGTDIGGFSFWLERPAVNLDGVVNNRELQDAIRDRRLAEYLERSDVGYIVAAFWDAPQAFVPPEKMYRSRIFPQGVGGPRYDHYDYFVYSYVHDAYSDSIRLCPRDEVFRQEIGKDGTANATLVIYRLRRPVTGKASCG